MKIRSSLILGVALQFGSITFAQDHKIEVTGDYSCIHANPQNDNLIPSFFLDGRGGSAVETHERREPAKVLAGTWTPPTVSSRGRLPQPFLEAALPLRRPHYSGSR